MAAENQGRDAAAAAAPLIVPSEWLHLGAALGVFYAANEAAYRGFAALDIKFPASLVGMFGILSGLWGLSASGHTATALITSNAVQGLNSWELPDGTLGNGHPAAEGRWAQAWLG